MKTLKWTDCIVMALFLLSIVGCSGGGGSDSGTGTLSLSLTDAPTDGYQAIYVTIKEVQIHKAEEETGEEVVEEGSEPVTEENGEENGSGWETILTPNQTYNLLELVNCTMTRLGDAVLAAGHYTQMRLILGDEPDSEAHPSANYLIDNNDEAHELKVPSGFQTGIKLVRGFEVIDEQTTDLILDFDASKSVVKAGSSGKWLLKPTIKGIDGDEYGTVGGFVTEGGEGVGDLKVQALDADTGTSTEQDGSYCMVLDPGTYTLVVDEEDYVSDPVKIPITVEAGYSYDHLNFELELKETPPSEE